jgi:TolB protein
MKSCNLLIALVSLTSVWFAHSAFAQADTRLRVERDFDENGFLQPVPVSISGFTGEVDSVLKHDLLFMGIKNVLPTEAKYLITGSNAGRVEGRVIQKSTKEQLFAKAYTGSSQRSQTHALADDIAKALTGLPGIAQTKIAFKVETGASVGEIYIADYDGYNGQAVTRDGSLISAPCWGGRTTLFYSSYKLGRPVLFSHELTSGARHAVARGPGSSMSPALSPDGRKVAYICDKAGSPNLYVCDSDGNNAQQLSRSRDAESSPCWSPDGRTICFVSRERGPANLYTISASGGTKRRLETGGVGNSTEPAWSPDGKWIAFTSQRGGFDLFLVRSQGGQAMLLTSGEDPTWAPNSRTIIFCKGPDHGKVLSLLDVPTKQFKDIARILESNSQPSWAP